jgi:hypothetical protein
MESLSVLLLLYASVVKSEWQDRLQLTPDDYLQGVIGASNELVRPAMLPSFESYSLSARSIRLDSP